jgi:hypothetical protein
MKNKFKRRRFLKKLYETIKKSQINYLTMKVLPSFKHFSIDDLSF